MIIFLCVCDDRSAAWRLWNHKTHHRTAGLVNTGFVLFFGLSIQKNVNIFLRKARHCWIEGCNITALWSVFTSKFFFWECCRKTLLYECVCCKPPFRSLLRMKLILWIYIVQFISFTFSLKCSVLKRSLWQACSQMNYNSLHSAWGTPPCKSITQREIIQYHVVSNHILRLSLWS